MIDRALPLLGKLSGDRLRHELNIILEEDNREQIISRLGELGVLQAIHPSLRFEGKWMSAVTQILTVGSIQEWGLPEKTKTYQTSTAFGYLYWLVKSKKDLDAIIDKLRIPGWLANDIKTVIELEKKLAGKTKAKKSEMTAMFEEASDFALFSLFQISRRKWIKDAVFAYINEWQHIKPITKGSDLKAMGLQPGPEFKIILGQIRAAMLDGKIKNVDEEKALLNELLDEQYNL